MDYTYKAYYKCLPEELKREIINLWVSEGVLTLEKAINRVDDVVLVGFDPNNKVCGVTTVYLEKLLDGYYYFFRMFIKESERGKIKLKGSKLTHEFLKDFDHPLKPKGVVAVAENVKITNRVMKSQGWSYFGKNEKNQDVYYVLF